MIHALRHPYDPGTRVCHAKENAGAALADGTAEVVEARRLSGGSYEYLVHADAGGTDSWPSYFTVAIAAPARGRRSADPAPSSATPAPVLHSTDGEEPGDSRP